MWIRWVAKRPIPPASPTHPQGAPRCGWVWTTGAPRRGATGGTDERSEEGGGLKSNPKNSSSDGSRNRTCEARRRRIYSPLRLASPNTALWWPPLGSAGHWPHSGSQRNVSSTPEVGWSSARRANSSLTQKIPVGAVSDDYVGRNDPPCGGEIDTFAGCVRSVSPSKRQGWRSESSSQRLPRRREARRPQRLCKGRPPIMGTGSRT